MIQFVTILFRNIHILFAVWTFAHFFSFLNWCLVLCVLEREDRERLEQEQREEEEREYQERLHKLEEQERKQRARQQEIEERERRKEEERRAPEEKPSKVTRTSNVLIHHTLPFKSNVYEKSILCSQTLDLFDKNTVKYYYKILHFIALYFKM